MLIGRSRRWLGPAGVYTHNTGITRRAGSTGHKLITAVAAVAVCVVFSLVAMEAKDTSLTIYQPVLASSPVLYRAQAKTDSPAKPASAPSSPVDPHLVKLIHGWGISHAGDWSIVVKDAADDTDLAVAGAHQTYFMASIYKLYVAYVGYQKVDDGTYGLTDPYLNGWSRGKCLDEMIRTSNSPCAEKLMAELGKDTIMAALHEYGLKDTSFAGFTTSAADTAIILSRLGQGDDLSADSRHRLLDSMLNQEYRNALPKGFAPLKVYDKVGFNGYAEYHDVGLVKLPGGHYLVVAVMTKNASVPGIAQLGQAILRI